VLQLGLLLEVKLNKILLLYLEILYNLQRLHLHQHKMYHLHHLQL
jgi:hypothetical protein